MKSYIAYLVLSNEYTEFKFETDDNPIEFLWTRFGMDTYIDSLQDITEQENTQSDQPVI